MSARIHARTHESLLQLQLWHLRIGDISDSDLRLGLSWLSPEELDYFRNCASQLRKRQFALGRLLLRGALSHLDTSRAPGQWRIVEGPHGRPSLAPDEPFIGFNLAHSDDRIVLVTGPLQRLGIDLEYGLKQRKVERLARRWFNPSELAELMQLEPAARQQWFYRLWTLKEAWSKARGEALAPSMRLVTVSGAEDGDFSVAVGGGETSGWRFLRVGAAPGFHCALACQSDAEIRLASRRMSGLARFEALKTQILNEARSA
ncbi:MAG: 4'-phosphopantetheinyl transferase superfamily protein [Gammaproteobacteria bacterium]|nr:4'-phosphopantetheinyl transferase superfamily protein [Gammaproteobacteria bacterium]MYA35279.1 4'-phosphopantetheinyl transferase superfamily protein [Gammaproteobacteria bacterium]MYC58897.1 4'-phosphopantetheinyl transferase superfamily protein [Gammaproteobacteria bacterium]MYH85565.1 4'-phosphopantetheinyl transferase superfamily protein [Gammaproteobacteria bacterium]MYK04697.1 4'-phosphopantetheinyl transferase superfamily protein [Gammaproteobacteria bacterium]